MLQSRCVSKTDDGEYARHSEPVNAAPAKPKSPIAAPTIVTASAEPFNPALLPLITGSMMNSKCSTGAATKMEASREQVVATEVVSQIASLEDPERGITFDSLVRSHAMLPFETEHKRNLPDRPVLPVSLTATPAQRVLPEASQPASSTSNTSRATCYQTSRAADPYIHPR
jgi:hypothetical protein